MKLYIVVSKDYISHVVDVYKNKQDAEEFINGPRNPYDSYDLEEHEVIE